MRKDNAFCNPQTYNSLWNKEEFPQQWTKSIIVTIYKKNEKTDCRNYWSISLQQLHKKFYSTSFVKDNSKCRKCIRIIIVNFDATSPLPITYSPFAKYFRKNGNIMGNASAIYILQSKPMIHLGGRSSILSFSLVSISNKLG